MRPASRAARRTRWSPPCPPSATTTRSRTPRVVVGDVVEQLPLELLLDPIGEPQQAELSQLAEDVGAKEVGQGRVDPVGWVDVAMGETPSERLRAHVDELDLVGASHHGVGNRLRRRRAGDRGDDVAHRLEVGDVDGGDHVDAVGEQLLDLVPPAALFVDAMGEVVDENDLRAALTQRCHVELGDSLGARRSR